RARANASSPHGYQSTGLWACCSRYGLVSLARRFWLTGGFRSARERQRADGGGGDGAVHPDADAGAGLRVTAPHEGERDGTAEPERARRAGDRADHRVAGHDLAAGRRHGVAVEDEPAQVAIHVAAIADADDDLLA